MTELAIKKEEIIRADMSPHELQVIAEEKATSILAKIDKQLERIGAAETAANNASDIKTSWWRLGNTGKKADATASALVQTNNALKEMNDLIQESIRFTCTSLQFAQVMHKTMAHMMVNGFKDAHGNIQKLAGESKEFVQMILDEADDFVRKQLAVEMKQSELEARLDQKEEIDAEQSRHLEELQAFVEDKHSQQKIVDAEQSHRLEELQALLDKSKLVDDEQQKEIRLLFDYIKQKDQLDTEQSELIQKLVSQQIFGKISLVLSSLALFASGAALALIYVR